MFVPGLENCLTSLLNYLALFCCLTIQSILKVKFDFCSFCDIIKIINMKQIEFINLVLLGLTCWRLTSLLYQEEGPFGIFVKLREKVGIQHIDGRPCIYPDRFLCKLFACIWCLSVWVSGLLVIGYIFLPTLTIYFSVWLSLSTITIMVNDGLLRN